VSGAAPAPQAPQPVDLLIVGADILTFDDADRVIEDGALAIDGNSIVWLGSRTEATMRYRAATTIDGSGLIALPGLIDCHFHTAQQFLRGKLFQLARRQKLRMPPWKNYYVPFEGTLTHDDVYYSGLSAYLAMISVGTTCFLEAGGPHPDAMGEAADEVGIRGVLALSTMDMDDTLPASMRMTTDDALKANEALVKRWRNHPRVSAWLAIRQIIVATEPLQRDMAALARELDTRIHTHLAEGTYEVDFALARWGLRPAEYLDSLGAFNARLHTAHAILLSPDEMDLYVQRGVSVAHCAFNNYAIGQPRLLEMWRRDVPIGLGTDGAASLGPLDIFQVAHHARLGQQLMVGTPNHYRGVVSGEELLGVAIRGGARAAGMARELGALAPGKRADVILVAATEPDQQPVYDPLFTAANNAVGRDVRTVIVDGRVVMRDRRFLTVDVDAIQAKLKPHHRALMERFEAAVA
jgi:5-methylthioadenosine/S-adenosylhomocysteine deaminase